ncbi:MAG: hypothetical protein K2L09_00705, partial [Alistipes sp.]|nr:hypothetical protein [Alistipes sp.]
EASKKAAEAGKSAELQLAGRVVAIHDDNYAYKQTEEGATRSTGRITVIDGGAYRDYLIFINGQRATAADLEAIPEGKIRKMTIYKGEQAVEKYGEEARNGVLDIQAKIRKNKK